MNSANAVETWIRKLAREELEALDLPEIIRKEIRTVLLSGLGTNPKAAEFAKAPKKSLKDRGNLCDEPGCGFSAKSPQGLGKHRYSKHQKGGHRAKGASKPARAAADKERNVGRRPGEFECPSEGCEESFSRKNGLTRHLTQTHGAEPKAKKYPCEKCTESFRSFHGLKLHALRDHPETPESTHVECEVCGESFHRGGIKRHKTVAHAGGAPRHVPDLESEEPRAQTLGEVGL